MVPQELSTAFFYEIVINRADSTFVTLPALARPFALFFQFGIEAVHVEPHGLLIGNLLGEVERETIRIVEFEDFGSGNHIFAGLHQLFNDFFQPLQSDSHH